MQPNKKQKTQTLIRIGFIGAGQVNFGDGQGPWDHASRLELLSMERELGWTLEIVGAADPDVYRAEHVVKKRQDQEDVQRASIWKDAKVYSNYLDMLDEAKPTVVFIGVPPKYHGSMKMPFNIEVECAKRNIHMFVEKPLSCHDVEDVKKVSETLAQFPNVIVSVGYMFRYFGAFRRVKELMALNNLKDAKAFNARYWCAYSTISKPMWWDVLEGGGPIIEQGTHFCDAARFLVGDVDMENLHVLSIKQTDANGDLNSLPSNIHEDGLPPERRVPRVTTAMWKFKNGAIGSFMHGALLHEIKYESELEVVGDGWRIQILDPYSPNCRLLYRLPGSEITHEEVFSDDMYLLEDRVFLDAVHNPSLKSLIQSPYQDAMKTYALTWAIKLKSQ